MGTSIWIVLVVIGSAILAGKHLAGHNIITIVLVRVAALCFMAAGVIGAGGWFGRWVDAFITWLIHLGQHAGTAAFGSALVVGAVVFVGAVAWLLALLPDTWWGGQMPDWGSTFGLFLPSLAVSIPGPAGAWFRSDVFPALAGPMIAWVRSWFGM